MTPLMRTIWQAFTNMSVKIRPLKGEAEKAISADAGRYLVSGDEALLADILARLRSMTAEEHADYECGLLEYGLRRGRKERLAQITN